MKESHGEARRELKDRDARVRSFRLSILNALRYRAKLGSIEKAADKLGEDRGNLSKRLKRFEQDWPLISRVVDAVRKESLFEKASSKEARKKAMQAKIKLAERGLLPGGHAHYGYDVKDGAPRENEDFPNLRAVFDRLRQGLWRPMDIAEGLGLSPEKVGRILRDRFYIGEFRFAGKTYSYRNHCKPLFTEQEWNEIQSLLAPAWKGPLLRGYVWKDGNGVLTEQGRRAYETLSRMRLDRRSLEEIAKELGWGASVVFRTLKDRRITGKIEVDGKLVDSGYEQAIDETTWRKLQEIRAKPPWEIRKEARQENERKIMSCMPAFRWELVDKGIPYITVSRRVVALKKGKMLKERDDGLLQRSWDPFPDKTWKARDRAATKRREKILAALPLDGALTRKELASKMGVRVHIVSHHARKMVREGILKEDKNGKLALGIPKPPSH